jgi:hypothetical protein
MIGNAINANNADNGNNSFSLACPIFAAGIGGAVGIGGVYDVRWKRHGSRRK